ncbi:hypothetical protein SGUI_1129 [Serinicoccus hydrothermalis]|uniref:Uncharacterized protein n=1 Tax=Serinicoccus hydrothermalis TaxID=1758689 RepID=A0A1B1NAY2_9MICO|nr:hypothetical protein [Serinicoccus hydrothermalis]ANS78525.1 hypothetical protein SGUI_1129 [Serinicoccus hydrothermalis]
MLWCDTGPALDDPAVTPPGLTLDVGEGGLLPVPCRSSDGSGEGAPPVALPPSEDGWQAAWEGDLPADGDAVLGIYEEAAHADYPFPGWPDPLPQAPDVADGEVSLDQDTPLTGQQISGQEVTVMVTSTVAANLDEDSTVELWTSVPGRIQVWLDGTLLTDDGDDLQEWQVADPALRDGSFSAFTAGQRLTLAVPPELAQRGEPVRVSAGANHGQPWQVRVTGADGPRGAVDAVAPVSPDALPDALVEWSGGMHRLAAWELPTDGTVAELELPEAVRGEPVTWVVACPGVDPSPIGMATITVDDGPRLERACADPEYGFGFVGTQVDLSEVPEGSSVRVGLPSLDEVDTGLVAAYAPVPFEDFDHAAGATSEWAFSAEAILRAEPEVVATLTLADLDADGVATLAVPEGASILRATSEGVGRLEVSHEERSLLDPGVVSASAREAGEQWWTAWTDQPSTQLVATHLERSVSSGDELRIEVEGYEGGSLTLELLAPADR